MYFERKKISFISQTFAILAEKDIVVENEEIITFIQISENNLGSTQIFSVISIFVYINGC